mmetsp:Transcript_2919/g.8432  ORF Transcript_2919/g.8432 Transcript_2919/m.8432 type:complete len:206 (+) Transcript_2919:711-1328(+)
MMRGARPCPTFIVSAVSGESFLCDPVLLDALLPLAASSPASVSMAHQSYTSASSSPPMSSSLSSDVDSDMRSAACAACAAGDGFFSPLPLMRDPPLGGPLDGPLDAPLDSTPGGAPGGAMRPWLDIRERGRELEPTETPVEPAVPIGVPLPSGSASMRPGGGDFGGGGLRRALSGALLAAAVTTSGEPVDRCSSFCTAVTGCRGK